MFKDDFPNYMAFDDTVYYTHSIPTGLNSAIQGLVLRHCEDGGDLKQVVNIFLTHVPCEPTINWGRDWLVDDLDSALRKLSKVSFHKFMDALKSVAYELGEDFINALNEEFQECEFGYCLERDILTRKYSWVLRDSEANRTEELDEAEQEVEDICHQAQEHLKQCRSNLINSTLRSRKDAVRDAMSAMESLMKNLSGKKDVEESTKFFREQNKWGVDIIVKDGVSIWNRLHDLYPDIRHGNPNETEISQEEALFWVERIITYIKYLSRMSRSFT